MAPDDERNGKRARFRRLQALSERAVERMGLGPGRLPDRNGDREETADERDDARARS